MKTFGIKRGLAVAALTALCTVTAALGAGGLLGTGNTSASADYNNGGFISTGSLFTGSAINKSTLTALYDGLSSVKSGDIRGVEAALAANNGHVTAAKLREYNENKDLLVTVQDMDWTVTYLSRDKSGNIIATLWLNDVGHTLDSSKSTHAPYSGGYAGGVNTIYPSNFYGSSALRAVLTKGTYSHSGRATIYDSAVEWTATTDPKTSVVSASRWLTFSQSYADYIVTPNKVAWQISPKDGYAPSVDWGLSVCYPNSYLDASLCNFAEGSNYKGKGSSSNNTAYDSWGGDYLWAPSLDEVGGQYGSVSFNAGLWQTSLQQIQNDGGVNSGNLDPSRANGTYNGTWLRSATAVGGSANSVYLNADGTFSSGHSYVCRMLRPAFHLNITKLYEDTATSAAEDTSDLAEAWNKAVENSLTNDGSSVTFTLTRDWTAQPDDEFTTAFGKGEYFDCGALFVPEGANIKLDLNGFKLDRNLDETPVLSGRVIKTSGATLEICDGRGGGKITGGNASREGGEESDAYGGGIYALNGSHLIISGGSITGNKSGWGGVYVRNSLTEITGGSICDNESNLGSGGGLSSYGSRVIMTGGVIYCNRTVADGGGVFAYESSEITINGGEIRDNIATDRGGGICGRAVFADMPIKITVNGGSILNNSAKYGGGICGNVYNGSYVFVIVNGGVIQGNLASNSGGGVYINGGADSLLKISGGLITRNAAYSYGGGVYSESITEMYGGEVSYNKQTHLAVVGESTYLYGGAGVYVRNGTLNMYGGKVTRNETSRVRTYAPGGGITVSSGEFNMYGGEVTENFSYRAGGGIYLELTTTAVIYDGLIKGNIVEEDGGGGICAYCTDKTVSCVLKIYGGAITENSAFFGGGVYCCENIDITLGGGRIVNNIGGNTDATRSAGIYFATGSSDTSKFTVTGGIVVGNKLGNGEISNLTVRNSSVGKVSVIGGKLSPDTCIGISGMVNNAAITSGFVTSGNELSSYSTHFFADRGTLTTAGNEIVWQSGTAITVRDNLNWTVSDGSSSQSYKDTSYISAQYSPEKNYSLSCSEQIYYIHDAAGRSVTTFNKVGKYYAMSYNSASYSNGNLVFEILPLSLEGATVTVADAVYDGSALKPKTTVTLGGKTLAEGEDYTVEYSNNVHAGGNATACVVGKGNYEGALTGKFTVERRNLNVRWGDCTKVYTGGALTVTAVTEGAVSGDTVNLAVSFTDEEGNFVAAPVDAGEYYAYAKTVAADDYKFADGVSYYRLFTVSAKPVDLKLEESSSEYTGGAQTPKPYYIGVDGDKYYETGLTMTGANGGAAGAGDADVYEVKITATHSADGNYVYTPVTRTLYYTITKAPVTAKWEEKTYTYTGSVVKPQLVLDGGDGEIIYKYYVGGALREEDRNLIPAIINAGTYTVRAYLNSNNYALSDGTETVEYLQTTVTVGKASFAPDNFGLTLQREYTGSGLSAESGAKPLESNFKVTYSKDGAEVDAPVNAGSYALKITDSDGNYGDYSGTFVVTPKSVAVVWSGDGYSYLENGTYYWLYDGKAHLPTAAADGVKITVTGSRTDVGAGTARAATADGNFTLTNTEAAFEVVRSTVVSIVWREYGGAAIESGKTPNYQWIAVYGADGPRLSAGGVLARYGGGAFTSELQPVIELKVTYGTSGIVDPANLNGYWFDNYEGTELKTITATAGNPTIPANCVLSGDVGGREQNFTVSALLVQTDKNYHEVVWAVIREDGGVISHETVKSCTVDDDGAVTVTENAPAFVYNGSVLAPAAIVILDKAAYDPASPKAGTYRELTVRGGQIGVGEYSAFVSADNAYSVRTQMLSCGFKITPLEIESVVWTGRDGTASEADGNFAWDYDGLTHAPSAEGVAADGTKCPVSVVGAVNAGTYVARVTADGNYTFAAGVKNATHAYVINKTDISDFVVWNAAGGTAVSGEDGKFSHYEFVYDGTTKFAPTAGFTVEINGVKVSGSLAVAGATANDGMHYAYAYIPSGDPVYANFSLDLSKAVQKFAVVRANPVTVRWATGENSAEVTGGLHFVYDGKPHAPFAYFIDDSGAKVALTVLGSGTEAGTYKAVVHDPRYAFAEGVEKEFKVLPQTLRTVVGKDTFVYDGTAKAPVISFVSEDGTAVEIGFTVTSAVGAGVHTAYIALEDKNYALDGYTVEFTVEKQVIRVVWGAETQFGYDEKAHAPAVTGGIMDNAQVGSSASGDGGYNITVTGAETGVGSYKAHAVIDNENYALENAERAFEIKPFEITVVEWTGADDGSFVWVYSAGERRVPSAKFTDWKGDEVALEVTGGEVNAGENYEAVAAAPAHCAFADGVGVQKFTILPQTVSNLVWYYKGAVASNGGLVTDFDGTVPQLSVRADGMGEDAIVVTGVGSDAGTYSAKAEPRNSGNIALSGNVEYPVTINPRSVNVIWTAGEGATVNGGTYTWNYDGKTHGVTASFEDINGVTVSVPVSGGSVSSVGSYVAKAVNVLGNYAFSELSDSVNIEILPQAIDFDWLADGGSAVNGDDGEFSHFEFVYDGRAHLPAVSVKNDSAVKLIYTVTDRDGKPVTAIGAGEYFVTVRTATPSSLAFADESGFVDGNNTVSVAFKINRREVTVVWGVTTLTYDGKAHAPEAWFVDANGQTVALAVTGAESEAGEGYTAAAQFINGALGANYVLKGETTPFVIERKFADKVEWDWENGVWVKPESAEPDPTEPETQR